MTDNLALPRITDDQTGKEITHNNAIGLIDSLLSAALAVDLTSANATISTANAKAYLCYTTDNQPGATRTVTFPAVKRLFVINNVGAYDVSIIIGSTTHIVEPDITALFYSDGTTNGLFLVSSTSSGGGGTSPALVIDTVSGTTHTLGLGEEYLRCTNSSTVTVTVPPNSSVAFDTGTVIVVVQAGTGQVTIAEGAGVTVNTAETDKSRAQYSSISLIYVGSDVWDMSGDIEVL